MGNIHDTIDTRNIEIDNVGICKYRLPITFQSEEFYNSVAEFKAGVSLVESVKGAHLSRIIEVLDEMIVNKIITIDYFNDILVELMNRLELQNANIQMKFGIVSPSITPLSNKITYLNSDIVLSGKIENYTIDKSISFTSNGAMLCPNSKSISKYGAHSQKCNLIATLYGDIEKIKIEDVLKIIFSCFSSEVYGIVKSIDEKMLTERAYENPKFSEDLVRDSLIALRNYYVDGKIMVEIENLESIHQHNVYAKGILK